ncbi:MAG: hypothetical protein WC759_02345 [Candidatus Micrarchaeia archaeon]|jgi:hypothetical protein
MGDDAEMKKRIEEVQEKYGHLLTKEAALALAKVGSAHSAPALTARILRIFNPYLFEKAGRKGKVCRAEIELLPQREARTLVLWDADVDRLGAELKAGDAISLAGAYEKDGELHIGKKGSVVLASSSEVAEAQSRVVAVIRGLRAEGDVLHATLEKDGKLVKELARGIRALELLGLKTAHEGISFYTVLKLKRDRLIGKTVSAS